MSKQFELVNRTDFPTAQLEKIATELLVGQRVPSFYLVCQTPYHNGLSVTNMDKPLVIIDISSLHQFAKTFVHEIRHLQQHAKGFADENFDAEVVVTDKYKTAEESIKKSFQK